jgi:Fe-S-cluster containining protein
MAWRNPCLSCGACCATHSFAIYWETSNNKNAPAHIAAGSDPFQHILLEETADIPPCRRLVGTVGKDVHCSIYDRRPEVCRSFTPSWADGRHNPGCDRARAKFGLRPLNPEDWDKRDQRPGTTSQHKHK